MPHVDVYVGLAHQAEQTLAESYRRIADGHAAEADVFHLAHTLAKLCDAHVDRLAPVRARYGEATDGEPERLHADGLAQARSGPVGLLRDLQDLHLLATLCDTTYAVLMQAAQGVQDRELLAIAEACRQDVSRQLGWLQTRLKTAAPQALLVG